MGTNCLFLSPPSSLLHLFLVTPSLLPSLTLPPFTPFPVPPATLSPSPPISLQPSIKFLQKSLKETVPSTDGNISSKLWTAASKHLCPKRWVCYVYVCSNILRCFLNKWAYRRDWLIGICAYHLQQQENMCLSYVCFLVCLSGGWPSRVV